MQTVQEFAETFPSEAVLQQALAKLLSKIPNHSGVQILQGSAELGKDIIFYTPSAFDQKDLNACVVKNTKITGNASTPAGARTVFNQAQQALDTPLVDENGREQKVKRVFIVTPYPIPPETVTSIVGALRAGTEQVQFISGAKLLDLFKQYWPEFLAEEFKLIQTYADSLVNAAGKTKELSALSFQHQLAAAETSIKRVYVQPQFHRIVRSYSLQPLYQAIPRPFRSPLCTQEIVDDIKSQLNGITRFISRLAEWGFGDVRSRQKARAACNTLNIEITEAWSKALAGRAAKGRGAVVLADSFSANLANVLDLNSQITMVDLSVREAFGGLEQSLKVVKSYMPQGSPDSSSSFVLKDEETINKVNEIARLSGARYMRQEDERQSTLTSAMVTGYKKPLFIVAPAGFGKTSFCRWHALDDLEKLLQHGSDVLPVYVPLHQVTEIEGKDFKEEFLRHAGVSALLPKGGRADYKLTRIYLDGLDEVANQATQKQIAQLASEAAKNDPTLQIIITARDYVYGSWMTWLPRVHLSGFDDLQIRELVTKWLDGNDSRIRVFFDQLEKSSSLKEMMTIPLLASLIVLVFKQTDKLPENKTRLYEIFVALHNGGWDLAKGVQRPSQFTATAKMFVLKRIAASIHKARRREMRDPEVAAIAEEALKAADWNALREELLRDGLIVEFGPVISFAHHSYQEFLTAYHFLGDLNPVPLNEYCEEYLKGSDWWQEVLCFYIDLAGKPQEIRAWLDERLRVVSKFAERRSTAEERVRFLRQYIDNSFPYAR